MRILKQIALMWLNRLAIILPPRWGAHVRNLWFFGRPVLDYLEFHVADHCNMNCAGCLHYSPYAEKSLANVDEVRRDFQRLKDIFGNIRKVRIMGGEPLLHPELVSFMQVVRENFPKCRVTIVTNGLLLSRQSTSFWEACRHWQVGIDFTVYPPMNSRVREICDLCVQQHVPLRVTSSKSFLAKIDPEGHQPMRESFRLCRREAYCPFLHRGHIYPCAESCLPYIFNNVAGTHIPVEKGMSLIAHSGQEILEYLMCPVFTCCNCSKTRRVFLWHNTDVKKEDWFR